MKRPGFIFVVFFLLPVILLAGCRTSHSARKNKEPGMYDTSRETLHHLCSTGKVSELTARMSFNLSGQKAGGQLRMRRDHCVQISVSVLGLVEVARIEFLPDKVVVMDRTSNRYALCHYADLPFRNELGLDFNVVQALFWNRVFSPGSISESDLYNNVSYNGRNTDGSSTFIEKVYDYIFRVAGDDNLILTSKKIQGRGVSIGYSDFKTLSDGFVFPMVLNLEITDEIRRFSTSIALSSVSTAKGSWPDETGISRRMVKVSLDELTRGLSL